MDRPQARGFLTPGKYLIVILAFLLAVLAPSRAVRADAQTIYVVNNEQDFFILLSYLRAVGSGNPIIYSTAAKPDPRIDTFRQYFSGSVTPISGGEILREAKGELERTGRVVVAENSREALLAAALIAAQTRSILWVGEIPGEWQGTVRQVVSVGNAAVSCACAVTALSSTSEALEYYNRLAAGSETVVLAEDPTVAVAAAEAAALHQARLAMSVDDAKELRPRNLIWITRPENINTESLKALYQNEGAQAGERAVYAENIGLITGYDLEDMTLLLARAAAYSRLSGEWKHKALTASVKSPDGQAESLKGEYSLTHLGGSQVTGARFDAAIRSVSHVLLTAHGSAAGFQMADGNWPVKGQTLALPPLVFAAEACETANFAGADLKSSVVLKVLSAGAVAYIGSVDIGGVALVGDMPFLQSSPQTPLGELVRLENSARMDLDADYPRAVLFGDPTFYQNEREDFSVVPAAGVMKVSSGERANVAVELPGAEPIVRAEAALADGARISYYRGSSHFGLPIATVPLPGGQKVLFEWPGGEGTIAFYPAWSADAFVQKALSDAISGLQAVLVDLSTIAGTPWCLPAGALVLILLARKSLNPRKLGLAGAVSLALAALIAWLLWGFNAGTLLPVIFAVAMWCAFSILLPARDRSLGVSLTLFISPFLFALLVAVGIGVSKRVSWMIVEGILLLSASYAVFFIAMRDLLYGSMRAKRRAKKGARTKIPISGI